MKFKQAFLTCAIALGLAAGLVGCEKDDTAVKALEDLTNQLSTQVNEQNTQLASLAEALQTCMKDLASAKGEAVVISATDATVDVPSLEGEANLASLEALKSALNKTIDKQKATLTELKTKSDQCAKDLQTAKADAEAKAKAAAAKAAASEAAAKRKAAEQEKATAKQKAKAGKWGR